MLAGFCAFRKAVRVAHQRAIHSAKLACRSAAPKAADPLHVRLNVQLAHYAPRGAVSTSFSFPKAFSIIHRISKDQLLGYTVIVLTAS